MADAQTATDNNGQYAFTGLRAGTYGVEISGFDMDEVGFGSVSSSATVGVGESKIISFDGTYLRTAGIMGQVSVEGVGLEGVTVTMTGEGEDETDVTDAGGLYGFSKLKAGTYSIAISGYDPDEVEFQTTSKTVTVALGETANEPFMGTLLRTSGISGRVSTEGEGRDGVTVTLAGAAEATQMTSNGGQYAFAGLAEGTYVVTISGWDEVAYTFETTSATIVLGDAESNITNFEGTHTRTAGISGVLFIDEVMKDGMLTTGEPPLTAALHPLVTSGALDPVMLAGLLAKAKVMLRGPDLNTVDTLDIDPLTSTFTSAGLVAGTYQVSLPVSDEMVAAGLATAGVKLLGGSMVRTIVAGETGTVNSTVNFPFEITMQTISVGAVMGNDEMTDAPVKGVTLALYPTAQDAEDGMNPLSEMPMMTAEMTGMAAFQFARADDTSPGSEASDNLVFVKVVETGHDDLMVFDNDIIEIEYPGIARVHAAPAHVRLLNVAVNVDFWVKSNATARSGDMGLGGWTTEVFMGEDTVALMMENADGDTVNLTEPTDTATAMDNKYLGKGTFSYRTVDEDGMPAVPATFYVRVDSAKDQAADGGEMFDAVADEVHAMGSEDGKSLMYEHTGLALPSDMNVDVGPMRITFTTQSLTVSIHRELDDVEGFTDFRAAAEGGDGQPSGDALDGLEVELLEIGSDGRARKYEYMLADGETEAPNPLTFKTSSGAYAAATFTNLPADGKFIVQLDTDPGLTVASNYRDGDEVFAHGSALDDYGESKDELSSAGYVAGGFGEGVGGAHHTVELCNLARVYDDPDFGCSTFAYKWNDGSVSGSITGLRKGDEATITLTPEGDFASEFDQKTTVKATSSANRYSFSNVADGEYDLILEGADGKWKEVETSVTVAHRVAKEAESSKGAEAVSKDLDATELRYVVKGVVANDEDRNEVVTGDEAMEGIVMEIYNTSHTRSGADAGRSRGAAALDEDGNPRTTVTDSDGNYAFTDLAEGWYIVQAKASDDYEVLRNGNAGFKASTGVKKLDAVTGMALVSASPPPPEDTDAADPVPPYWNHNTSMVHREAGVDNDDTDDTGPDVGDFALLYGDGQIEGLVTDPSAGAKSAYADTRVRLRRCLTYTDGDDNCVEYDGPGTFVDVSDKGAWATPRDLREGIYVVALDLPVGYENVVGGTTGTAEDRRTEGPRTAVVELIDGRRSSESTAAFWIRNGLTNVGVEVPVATVKDVLADNGFITSDVSSVMLTLTLPEPANVGDPSSKGATMKVGTSSFADGVAKSLAVRSAGTFHVNVAVTSEDGYASALYSSTAGIQTPGADGDAVFTFVKDAKTQMRELKLGWVGSGITKSRAQLAGQSGFEAEESRRSAEIAGTALTGPTVTQIDDIVLPKGTTGSVTIAATAMEAVAAAVTVTTEGTGVSNDAFTAPDAGATNAVTVDITITDAVEVTDRNPQNTRTYRVKISVAS